jgi:transposase
VLRGKDVQEMEGLKRQGLSIQAISELTGYDRKTVRKYLIVPDGIPVYQRPEPQSSKLDAFKPYLQERLRLVFGMHACCCASYVSAAIGAVTRF